MPDRTQKERKSGKCSIAVLLIFLVLSGCDSVEPVESSVLVVEGFLDTGKPLPELTLRQTRPIWEPYADDSTTSVADASVRLDLDGRTVPYYPLPGEAGRYAPDTSLIVSAESQFALRVQWNEQVATASGTIPPAIQIDSVQVQAPPEPVEAVFLDTLRFDTLGTGAVKGFIYPVEVSIWWTQGSGQWAQESPYWIRAHLNPVISFSSTVVDYFLRQDQILQENTIEPDVEGRHRWTGVYAVPVSSQAELLPTHELKVTLIRSGEDYARFASSRGSPERREPVSNISGAIGIFAGISVDSLRIQVKHGGVASEADYWQRAGQVR